MTLSVTWPYLRSLYADGVRNLSAQSIDLSPGINCFVGPNGSGKTSLLEGFSLLSTGRSFRVASAKPLIQHGREDCLVRAELMIDGQCRKLGIQRSKSGGVSMRVDGAAVGVLADFVRVVPSVVVDPEATELVVGPPDNRRRLLDGILFHVEQTFYPTWRRYQRALQQRNADLRHGTIGDPDPWLPELISAGGPLTTIREHWASLLEQAVRDQLQCLSPGLPEVQIKLRRGWAEDASLEEALGRGCASDRDSGFTRSGPHRADLRLMAGGKAIAEVFSRGQIKLVTVALRLAQGALMGGASGVTPVYLVDDVAAELDGDHTQRVFEVLGALQGQVMLTSVTTTLSRNMGGDVPATLFHVEQGRILPVG